MINVWLYFGAKGARKNLFTLKHYMFWYLFSPRGVRVTRFRPEGGGGGVARFPMASSLEKPWHRVATPSQCDFNCILNKFTHVIISSTQIFQNI